jgi:hypothetical protein
VRRTRRVLLIPVYAFSETYAGNQILLAVIAICNSSIVNPQILGLYIG